MNVSLTIDVANVKQVEALERLMRTLGELPMVENLRTEPQKVMQVGPGPSTTATEKATRSRKAKTPQVEEPQMNVGPGNAELAQVTANQAINEIIAKTANGHDYLMGEDDEVIDIAMLRALTAEKAATHRAEIKEKLAELGAANVTSIPKESYNEYYDFIALL